MLDCSSLKNVGLTQLMFPIRTTNTSYMLEASQPYTTKFNKEFGLFISGNRSKLKYPVVLVTSLFTNTKIVHSH